MKKATTKPKGATSYKETTFGIIPRSKLLRLELEGTKKGLEFLHDSVKKQKDVKITPDFVCKLHEISFGWIFPTWVGKYRKIQVTFSGKEAPPYYQVPELIINLCNDLEERLKHLPKPNKASFVIEVIKLLTWFQHRFVFVHPFQDYNGRTARMVTNLILLKLNLPVVEIKAETVEDRKRYITAMQKADKEDFSPLETLIGTALSESLERFQETF